MTSPHAWIAGNDTIVFPSPTSRSLIVMTKGLGRCSCDEDRDAFRDDNDTNCLVDKLGDVTRGLVSTGIAVYVIGYIF